MAMSCAHSLSRSDLIRASFGSDRYDNRICRHNAALSWSFCRLCPIGD